ncbi:ribonuclease P protein component [Runella slithyformis]|uniref:Ribonuclease P protein component n=1 Tax=Runella slithyformis (strain ATCC 29530 / DSM 19594 / LMG 11500 / NCIMB 11436 / LSU 4) TaxID=761193 RepID=A0A7U3ZII6_RUNSL|nr:ribonuclease P protein component [Runella slithyformis]AEI47841.1 Ribonuclease P protein component [Runella slithyformis DSM 19594]
MRQTLQKIERLSSSKVISRLFEKGSTETQTSYLFPFKVFYLYETSDSAQALPQVLFTISKRNFKRAVDRNLLRRRCREAYRKNKHLFFQTPELRAPSYIAFIFIAKEKTEYDIIERSMQKLIGRMSKSADTATPS